MPYEYEIHCTIDIGKSVDAVGSFLKGVNGFMKELGFDEQISCQSKVSLGTLTCDRELTSQERDDMKTLIGAEIMKSPLFRDYGLRVVSISRKSGKSGNQSYKAERVAQ